MEYTEEIKETLIKINDFIQADNNANYKIRLLEREVPNLQELVKKLTIPVVSGSSLIEIENAYIEDADTVDNYDATGRVSKLWITKEDFEKIKCINN